MMVSHGLSLTVKNVFRARLVLREVFSDPLVQVPRLIMFKKRGPQPGCYDSELSLSVLQLCFSLTETFNLDQVIPVVCRFRKYPPCFSLLHS